MEATGGEMFAQQHNLEGGEMMLAKMVEERDKNKLDLFLQEMDNVDKFLEGAEAMRSGHDQSSSGMDDLLQLSYGDLIPMKDIPMMIEGMTSAVQGGTAQEADTIFQNVVPQMISRSRVKKGIKGDTKPIVKNNDSMFDWLKTKPPKQNQKPKKPSEGGFNKFGISIQGPSQNGNLSLKCEICEKDFTTTAKLAKHISRCINNEKGYFDDFFQIAPELDLKVEKKANIADADGLESIKNLKCTKCQRQFFSHRTLTKHARGHNRITRFPCPHCDVHLRSAKLLATHVMIHTGEKPHKCSQCGKSFRLISGLQQHKITHQEKKPFPCPKCDKAYCEYKSLMYHFKSHTGEKPFSCQICKKPFKDFSNMRAHQKKAHEEGAVFKCGKCDYKSFDKKLSEIHHQIELLKIPLFECDICQMSCASGTALKMHKLNKHDGVKFPCPQCDYKATQ